MTLGIGGEGEDPFHLVPFGIADEIGLTGGDSVTIRAPGWEGMETARSHGGAMGAEIAAGLTAVRRAPIRSAP